MDSTIIAILIAFVIILMVLTNSESMNSLGQLLCVGIVAIVGFLVSDVDDETSSKQGGTFYGGAPAKPKKATSAKKNAPAKPKKAAPAKKAAPSSTGKPELTSAGVVPVSKDGKKVLIAQTKSGMWTFIRGHLEGKKPEGVAIDALKANTGIVAKESDFKEKLVRDYKFEVSEESYKKHLERMKKRGMKPQIKSAGKQHRQQLYYVAVLEDKEPKVNMDALRDAKWMSWADAESYLSGAKGGPVSKQIETLKEAKDWAKKNIK